jgi:hypothetical protein
MSTNSIGCVRIRLDPNGFGIPSDSLTKSWIMCIIYKNIKSFYIKGQLDAQKQTSFREYSETNIVFYLNHLLNVGSRNGNIGDIIHT